MTIDGTAGNETLTGGGGNDVIRGFAGSDRLFGGDGDDILDGGAGTDLLDGGAGVDTASYADATAAVTVSLATTAAQDTIGAGRDTLVAIENLTGSRFNDKLSGTDGDNILDGGDGVDTASYALAGAGVVVDLGIATVQNTVGAGRDQLLRIESLIGSGFDDRLAGNAWNNVIAGGGGTDTVSYTGAGAGVIVNLGLTAQQDTGGAGKDTIYGVENVTGSAFADKLSGTDGDNRLDGGLGRDTVSYAGAAAGVTVSLALTGPQATIGAGSDTLIGFENLTGSAFDDVLAGTAGDNIVSGGDGVDTLSYAAATAGVTVDLGTVAAQQTADGADTIYGIEHLVGTRWADDLSGNNGDNRLDGSDGGDRLAGGGGTNIVNGGAGDDQITTSTGRDTVDGGTGNDGWFGDYSTSTVAQTIAVDGWTGVWTLPNATTLKNVESISITTGVGNDLFTLTNTADVGGEQDFLLNAGGGVNTLVIDDSTNLGQILNLAVGDDGSSYSGTVSRTSGHLDFDNFSKIVFKGGLDNDVVTIARVATGSGPKLDIDGAGYGNTDTLTIDLTARANASFVLGPDNAARSGPDIFRNFEVFNVSIGAGSNTVVTGDSDDLIVVTATPGSDVIDTGKGDDTIALSGKRDQWSLLPDGSGGLRLADKNSADGDQGSYHLLNVETIQIDDGNVNTLTIRSSVDGIFSGTSLYDDIIGSNNDDVLIGYGGVDFLLGEEGVDTAVFEGLRSDYSITPISPFQFSVTLKSNPSTIDYLSQVELLRFSDETIAYDRVRQFDGKPTADVFTVTDDNSWIINGGGGADKLTGGGFGDVLVGGKGADVLIGGGGNDEFRLYAGDGVDTIDGGYGSDSVIAYSDNLAINVVGMTSIEFISGHNSREVHLVGSESADTIDLSKTQLNSIESIAGLGGADTIFGSSGDDRIIGGAGRDTLTGNAGRDVFAYDTAGHSGTGSAKADHIVDFTPGEDVVDLRGIDANVSITGNQAFGFIGSAAFTGLGQVRFGVDSDGHTALFGNVRGTLAPDFEIVFDNDAVIGAADLFV